MTALAITLAIVAGLCFVTHRALKHVERTAPIELRAPSPNLSLGIGLPAAPAEEPVDPQWKKIGKANGFHFYEHGEFVDAVSIDGRIRYRSDGSARSGLDFFSRWRQYPSGEEGSHQLEVADAWESLTVRQRWQTKA